MMKLFINTYYENASILRWEQNENGIIDLFLIPDHERFLPNHQITHWNFKVEIPPEHLRETMTFRFRSMTGCYNGEPYRALAGHDMVTAISYGRHSFINSPNLCFLTTNGSNWETIECTPSEHPECGPEFSVKLKSELIQIAHLVPYTDSMLQTTIRELEATQDVRVYNFGSTVENRALEMIEVGNPDADNQGWMDTIKKHVDKRPEDWELIEITDKLDVATESIGQSSKNKVVATLLDGWGVYATCRASQWGEENTELTTTDETRFVEEIYSEYHRLVSVCDYLFIVAHVSAYLPTASDYELDRITSRVRAVTNRCITEADKVIYHDTENVSHEDESYVEQMSSKMIAGGYGAEVVSNTKYETRNT